MKFTFPFLLLFIFSQAYSVERTDSTKSKLHFSGNVSFNSNGMAPIPSFSLGKPALIANLALQKNRFSYDPQVAYGIDMKPWIIDNWLHYRIIYRPRFELRAGFDFSMFFSKFDAGDYKILRAEQYLTAELASVIKFSPTSILNLMYWNDNGQEHGSIRGHFYNLIYEKSDIAIGKSILFFASLQLFYISYTGKNDGFFVSPKVALSVRDIPLSLYFQATQAVTSNIEPFPGFRWNVGLAYMF